jgi:molybdopterin/thiamine biosynthesis adenylyltransferase
MSGARITFLGTLETRLKSWLRGHPEGHERAAWVLFKKFDRGVEGLAPAPRYVAIDMIELDEDWVLHSSATHIRFNMRLLPDVFFRCEKEGLELGFVHSHPTGASEFSAVDDRNEQAILRGYAGANGQSVSLVSLVLCDTKWLGRVRRADNPITSTAARHVSVLDDNVRIYLASAEVEADDTLLRQEAAFGKPFNQKLRSLRAVVVGAGGTGSPLATLLARAGIGELVIVDGDDLEQTNLNRVRGYGHTDVGHNKAERLAAYINSLGLPGTVAVAIPEFLQESPEAIDALSSADVIFGCTDDVGGRDLLNQATYYYSLAYIDSGLTGAIGADDTGPYLRDHRGRVSVVLPESGACLRCQRVVTDAKLAYERAVRERPELAELDPETLRREFYLTGGQESAPGVGPFTSATADFAAAALMDLIRGFRRPPDDIRQDNLWVDFVHLSIYSNGYDENAACFCCGSSGLRHADERGFRLGTPALGKIT